MLNVSVNISSGKIDYTSSILTYRSLDTQFEIKIEKVVTHKAINFISS